MGQIRPACSVISPTLRQCEAALSPERRTGHDTLFAFPGSPASLSRTGPSLLVPRRAQGHPPVGWWKNEECSGELYRRRSFWSRWSSVLHSFWPSLYLRAPEKQKNTRQIKLKWLFRKTCPSVSSEVPQIKNEGKHWLSSCKILENKKEYVRELGERFNLNGHTIEVCLKTWKLQPVITQLHVVVLLKRLQSEWSNSSS